MILQTGGFALPTYNSVTVHPRNVASALTGTLRDDLNPACSQAHSQLLMLHADSLDIEKLGMGLGTRQRRPSSSFKRTIVRDAASRLSRSTHFH